MAANPNWIKGKPLVKLERKDIEEWISEDIERINWYVKVSSKLYEREVYPKMKVIRTKIDEKTGEEKPYTASVYDKTKPCTIKKVPMALGDLKAELVERFPELGYGSTKEKVETESHAAAAARLLAAYNAKNK